MCGARGAVFIFIFLMKIKVFREVRAGFMW